MPRPTDSEHIRVLHCPHSVGGNAWGLSRAERELGLRSDVLVFSGRWLAYPVDVDLRMNERSTPSKVWTLSRTLIDVARHYDVVHFNWGASLMSRLPRGLRFLENTDLPLLKAMGKGIVVTYQGCDARQKQSMVNMFKSSVCSDEHCGVCDKQIDRLRARRISRFDSWADAIFSVNPDLLHVLPERARFIPYSSVNPREWPQIPPVVKHGERFVIVHAPTNRDKKGTKYIVSAVEALRMTYPEVELQLVEGVPHRQARTVYAKADMLIDQVLIGWYGALAVEFMAMAKPVVCFIRQSDLVCLPEEMRSQIPIVNARPDTLKETLERLLRRRQELTELGEKGRRYVEKWHDPMKHAEITKATYEEILGA